MFYITLIIVSVLCYSMATMCDESQVPLPAVAKEHVPGENGNTTYCTVPRSLQLFEIEFFDVAPVPVPVDQIFFTYLRGSPIKDVTGLERAQFRITISAELDTNEPLETSTYTIPLATIAFPRVAHLTIRYEDGKFGGPLQPGVNEILSDYWFPSMFLRTGHYKFKIEAFIQGEGSEKDRYLFAFQFSQRLEGTLR